MGFYYFSFFSVLPLAVAYGVLSLVFVGIVWITRRMPGRIALLSAVGVLLLPLPVAEELWIAWHFNKACQESGTVVRAIAQVEGFYDDTRTTHAGVPSQQAIQAFEASGYRFLEMKGREGVVRVEKINGDWKSSVLDHPSARYHYKTPRVQTTVSYKITVIEKVVLDTKENRTLARQTIMSRQAPWFHLSPDRPLMQCGHEALKGLLYEHALKPK